MLLVTSEVLLASASSASPSIGSLFKLRGFKGRAVKVLPAGLTWSFSREEMLLPGVRQGTGESQAGTPSDVTHIFESLLCDGQYTWVRILFIIIISGYMYFLCLYSIFSEHNFLSMYANFV